MVPDKPGEGARALNVLKEAKMPTCWRSPAPEGRRTQLDFFPADTAAFKQAAKKAKWKVRRPERGFLVGGTHRRRRRTARTPGVGARINVTAIDAASVNGGYGAIFWVAPKDVKKTAALLGAS